MSGLFTWWAGRVYAWRFRILIAWVLLIGLGVGFAASLPRYLEGGGWVLPESETGRTDALLMNRFGWDTNRTDLVVFTSTQTTYADPIFRKAAESALDRLSHAPGVSRVLSAYSTGDRRLVSTDGHTTYALVSYDLSETETQRLIPAYRAMLPHTGSVRGMLTGPAAFNHDIEQASEQDVARVDLLTLPVVFVLLLLVFGSVLAGLVPVILGASTVSLALGALALVAHVTKVSTFAPNAASMLGLGLGIDFSLLFVTRFREELAQGLTTERALARTVSTSGFSILYSGLTLALAMGIAYATTSTLLLRSMSLAIVLVALIAVACALTLLPALLGVIGRRVDSLRLLPTRAQQASFWQAWAEGIMRAPWRWTLISGLVLLVLAVPGFGMRKGFPKVESVSSGFESRSGFMTLVHAFGPGEFNPVYITVRTTPQGLWSPRFKAGLAEWTTALTKDPRVKRVDAWPVSVGPARFQSLTPFALAFDPLSRMRSRTWANLDGAADTTLVAVVPRKSDRTDEVRSLVLDLRADRAKRYFGALHPEVLIGGSPGNTIDFIAGLYRTFPLMIAGVVAMTFCVLLLFMRSIWLPLKAVVMTLASILATFGVLTMVFQYGWGAGLIGLQAPGYLTAIVPMLLFATLFGLSTDYEVFLLTRIRELHLQGASDTEAVGSGLALTGRVITAAAGIMVAVFMTFAFSGVTLIKEIGVGLTIGVLLDATLVRVVLVPATMRLMGSWNWYLPAWLDARLPRLAHEGSGERTARVPKVSPVEVPPRF